MGMNMGPAHGPSDQEATNQSHSTVCEVCEGFGQPGHPRSKIVQETQLWWNFYVYLHYPDPRKIQYSYNRYGCQTCRLILSCIQNEPTRSLCPQGEQPQDGRQSRGAFDLAQDTSEAASLVNSARISLDNNSNDRQLEIQGCRSGRVALCMDFTGEVENLRTGNESHRVSIHVFKADCVAPSLSWQMRMYCSPVDPIDEDHAHRPARDLLSDAHVGLVRRWMSTCEAEHKTCTRHRKTGSMQGLPTRLLGIEGKSGEVVAVKLVDTKDIVAGAYACLSYCWGSSRQLSMTTTANRNEYRHGIPWKTLPNTISDAIQLCYKLGFEYLWVDSLCIIQDDHEDWKREASRMAGIYSRSVLTLAIHLCVNSSESFLQKRLIDSEQWSEGRCGSARVAYTDRKTGDAWNMYLWQDQSFKGSRFLDASWLSISAISRIGLYGKWFRRAWTFQEWFMSPRVLHIHAMTVWDCLDSQGNELEKRFLYRPIPRVFSYVYLSWSIIVSEFTSRRITIEKDRLPALAGLAERFQEQTGYHYLAGLWLETLPGSLLWQRDSRSLIKTSSYRAPTWSWAALEGAVRYPAKLRDRSSSTCKIIGHHCQYDPPETLASVTDGWLDIEGSMSTVSGCAEREDSPLSQISLFTHDQFEDIQNPQSWIATIDQGKISEEIIRHSEVYLLDVLVTPRHPGDGDESILYKYALVLQVANRPGMEKDCFQRLGTAHLEFQSSETPVTDSWPRRTIRVI